VGVRFPPTNRVGAPGQRLTETFQAAINYYSGPGSTLCGRTADLNGDGHLDLIVKTTFYWGASSVLLGKGDGHFRCRPSNYPVGGGNSAIAGS